MDSKPSSRRQRVSAEERTRFVSLYCASGLTPVEFAQQQGIKPSTLHQWIYRSGPKKRTKNPTRFREFPLSSLLAPGWQAELALDSGMTLRLSQAALADLSPAGHHSMPAPCAFSLTGGGGPNTSMAHGKGFEK